MTWNYSDEQKQLLSDPRYRPGVLLNAARRRMSVTSDRQLADRLGTDTSVIARTRNKKTYFSARLLLRILHHTGLTFDEAVSLSGYDVTRGRG